jgi:hypothetical protein
MSEGQNYDYFMKEVQSCVKKKNDETALVRKVNGTDVKNLHGMDVKADPNLVEYKNSSEEMENRLRALDAKQRQMDSAKKQILQPEKKGGLVTNYGTRWDPHISYNRLDWKRDGSVFDERYYDYADRKRNELNRLEDDKFDREAEACTFTPAINELSRVLNSRTDRPPLHERYLDELNYKNEKMTKERNRVAKEREDVELTERRKLDKKMAGVRQKSNIYENNIGWYDKKEKHIFEQKMVAYDKITDGCRWYPQTNKNYNKRVTGGDFLNRQSNHIENVNKKNTVNQQRAENHSYKPMLCTKSLWMAEVAQRGVVPEDDFNFFPQFSEIKHRDATGQTKSGKQSAPRTMTDANNRNTRDTRAKTPNYAGTKGSSKAHRPRDSSAFER